MDGSKDDIICQYWPIASVGPSLRVSSEDNHMTELKLHNRVH